MFSIKFQRLQDDIYVNLKNVFDAYQKPKSLMNDFVKKCKINLVFDNYMLLNDLLYLLELRGLWQEIFTADERDELFEFLNFKLSSISNELPRVLIDLKHHCDKYGDDEIIFSYVEDYAIDILSALLANDDDKNILDWVQNIENIICNRKYNDDNNLMSEIIMLISIGGEKYNLFFPFYETIIQKINAKLLELGIEMPKIIVKPLLEKDNFDKFLKANKEFEQNFKKMFDNRKCKTYLDISNGQHADNEPYQSDLKHGDEVELFLRDFLLLTSDRDKDSKHFCETQLNDAEFGWKTCKFDKYLKDFNTMELIENFVGSLDNFQCILNNYLEYIFKFLREKGLREEFLRYKIENEFKETSPNPYDTDMMDFHETLCKMFHNFSSYKLYLQGFRERGIKRSPTFLIKENE